MNAGVAAGGVRLVSLGIGRGGAIARIGVVVLLIAMLLAIRVRRQWLVGKLAIVAALAARRRIKE